MHDARRRARRVKGIATATIRGVVLFGLLTSQLIATAPGEQADTDALVAKVVDLAGVNRGICALLGCDGDLPIQIAQATELLVHVREPESAAVAGLRRRAEEAGLGMDRLVVEQGTLDRLPYADNVVDVILATRVSLELLARLPLEEVLRVLRPQGKAILCAAKSGGASDTGRQRLRQWARADEARGARTWTDRFGTWALLSKPRLPGADAWSHWEHGPDNNPVSSDQAIKAPYMTQFLAEPFYIGMPAITTAAGGRTFLATGHIAHHEREWDMVSKLIARNGYNGVILWQRDLPPGYLSHRSAFVATEDTFYMIDGGSCLMLDTRTGEEKGRIRIPGLEGDWKWMAMQDGVLFVMAGEPGGEAKVIKGDRNFGGWSWGDLSEGYYARPRVPWGFGHTLAAYRLDAKRVLWRHKEDAPVDSRALAMRDGKLFLYCPDSYLRCLNAGTGKTLWTNSDPDVLGLIEAPGRGLVSTPGFRSACMAVATPKALIIQGQTRMNVVAVSTENGELLWQKKKISNNPNAIFVDGTVVLGVGPGSNHVVLDPVSGAELENLNFRKVACTRLTASPDSFFVRGEGTLRFDRTAKRLLIDGAVRPGCNDGALPANGMLYIGPWACDCNLSLIGAIAKCSAGDFRFDHVATEAERLQRGEGNVEDVAPLEATVTDWPTYRANNQRTSSTTVRLARPNAPEGTPPAPSWTYVPPRPHVPTTPTAAGGLVFVAGQDGKVRALDARTGELRWGFATAGPIKMPPTIWEGRAYVGSGDGHVYALEAATGRLLWRFRAAPIERHIMVYGNLCSTWPVNTGVLVADGVAYFAAGIIDYDGTYVYAVDARTGRIKWQNNSCGHLSAEVRKGVSAQGNLTIRGDELLMAGGNQVSPARFSLETGECLNQPFAQGQPKANHGRFVGIFRGEHPIVGGRTLYASPENVANKDSFVVGSDKGFVPLNYGGIPPAWNDDTFALVNFRDGKLTCCDAEKVADRVQKGMPPADAPGRRMWFGLANVFADDGAVRWTSDLNEPNKFEVVSLAVCPASVVAVVKYQVRSRAHPQWFLAAFSSQDGTPYWFWRYPLPSKPLPEGLLVGRDGQVVLTMLDGRVLSLGPRQPQTAARGARD
ncbi:MAG: PQQ-binding-like beta-propeller repeat protein [Armatimonadota bacterium]